MLSVDNLRETALFKKLVQKQAEAGKTISCDNVEDLCREASERMKQMPALHGQFTLHDDTHLLRVTHLMEFVLGATLAELNGLEIALLILAAHYHDQGMVPDDNERAEIENSDDFKLHLAQWAADHPNLAEMKLQLSDAELDELQRKEIILKVAELQNAALGEFIRKLHGERSKALVLKQKDDKRLEVDGVSLTDALAMLCLSHVQSPQDLSANLPCDKLIGTHVVNLRYLAIALRLADILDFDRERTPDTLYRTIHFTSSVSIIEWEKHRSVQGWIISPDLVRFDMEFAHPIYERSARQFMDQIDQELSAAHSLLRSFPAAYARYKLHLPLIVDRSRMVPKNLCYVYHDLEFSLSRDNIVKLLMTNNLYGQPSLCVRELLQNSLDALRYRQTVLRSENFDLKDGAIYLEHGLDENHYEFLRCTDNGIGMDEEIICDFLSKAGRSFYRSPWFERERIHLRQKGLDFDPCAQFGIGFMSCFMLGDRICVETRRDYGPQRGYGKPWIVEINGLSSIFVLRPGPESQPVGTTVTIICRPKSETSLEPMDQVKLVATLKEYARAVDYPIHGICTVPEYENSVSIAQGFNKPLTYLETLGVKQLYRIDQHISEREGVNSIDGVVSQSFLVDEGGRFVLSNSEAAWEEYDANSGREYFVLPDIHFRLRRREGQSASRRIMMNRVIFADGIEVYSDSPTPNMGVHPVELIDTRGAKKPELTPARRAVTTGETWNRLFRVRARQHGMVWAQLAEHLPERLTIGDWWQLARIYGAPIGEIPSEIIWTRLQVPVGNGNKIRYLSFADLQQVSFEKAIAQPSSAGYRLVTRDGEPIGAEQQALVLSFLELRLSNDNLLSLHVIPPISPHQPPLSAHVLGAGRQTLKEPAVIRSCWIMLGGNLEPALCALCGPTLVNARHPLVQKLDGLRNFQLSTFIANISSGDPCNAMPAPTLEQLKSRKNAGLAYSRIRWEKLDSKAGPPFKLFSQGFGWRELTDADLRTWAQISLPDGDDIAFL
jgi:hypothetical protein